MEESNSEKDPFYPQHHLPADFFPADGLFHGDRDLLKGNATQKPVINIEGVVTAVEDDRVTLEDDRVVFTGDATVFARTAAQPRSPRCPSSSLCFKIEKDDAGSTPIFVDHPAGDGVEDFYELRHGHLYGFHVTFRLATNVDGGMVGVGGPPGSSGFVKGGVTTARPRRAADELGQYRLNEGHPCRDASGWAKEAGFVTGYGPGRFGPEDDLTVEQAMAILYRYTGSPAVESGSTDFSRVSVWARDSVA